MFEHVYGPSYWRALHMAPLFDERTYHDRSEFGWRRSICVLHRCLMVEIARLMIATGTRMNNRYGYAA